MKFTDLKFESSQHGGFSSHTEINGHVLSVQCGCRNYCSPRRDLSSVEKYSCFEIAVWKATDDREWCTGNFIETTDRVAGWVSREEIEKIIEKIIAYKIQSNEN